MKFQALRAVEAMRTAAKFIANNTAHGSITIDELYKCADDLECNIEQMQQGWKDKLEFMVEMTRLDHNIDMDDNGEFKSELTNAMFVGWMAKVNKENK